MRTGRLQLFRQLHVVAQVILRAHRVEDVARVTDGRFRDLACLADGVYRHAHVLDPVEAVEDAELTADIQKGSGTILLIDDEEMILDVGRELLEELGYIVIPTMSGQEAIEKFQKSRDKIDMIIMDMIMPGMSGSETFDALQELSPGLKVLLSSGYALEGEAAEIMTRGCNGFIQKPFTISQLSRKIQEVLSNSRG